MELLRLAQANDIIDQDALKIFDGAVQVSDMQVREIMIPRSQMIVVKFDDPVEDIIPQLIEAGHSRFPVVGESIDDLKGILLAKDLLPFVIPNSDSKVDIQQLLRPASIVPESKRLNVLLREFRELRNHMVIVIDEYGDVAGLVTIEDILEEIVGEIEDEYDTEEETFIRKIGANDYIVKALTPIEDFNEELHGKISDDEFDTIGGIVTSHFGRVPQRNEEASIDDWIFRVLRADKRQAHLFRLRRA
jgi:magnesium and cobalt transporter